MARFDDNGPILSNIYNSINGILSKEDLRSARAGTASFSSNSTEAYVNEKTLQLATQMSLPANQTLKLCENNTLVFSKLILSFYRRAHALYMFHAEGRVRTKAPEKPKPLITN